MVGFFLGFAFGVIFCELVLFVKRLELRGLKKVENELLVGELNKLKEQIEKQN